MCHEMNVTSLESSVTNSSFVRPRHCGQTFSKSWTMESADYNVGIAAEDIKTYRIGGLHPVHLGDCFKDGQYKIVHKLGYGSFSTVWLARDIQYVPIPHLRFEPFIITTPIRTNRNVSLKIVVAEKSWKLDNELRILKYLNESNDSTHPGKKHVVHLLDSFYYDGPNGRHLCLIFDVIGQPLFSLMATRLNGRVARNISTQVLLAVDYLHSSRIVHGGEFFELTLRKDN